MKRPSAIVAAMAVVATATAADLRLQLGMPPDSGSFSAEASGKSNAETGAPGLSEAESETLGPSSRAWRFGLSLVADIDEEAADSTGWRFGITGVYQRFTVVAAKADHDHSALIGDLELAWAAGNRVIAFETSVFAGLGFAEANRHGGRIESSNGTVANATGWLVEYGLRAGGTLNLGQWQLAADLRLMDQRIEVKGQGRTRPDPDPTANDPGGASVTFKERVKRTGLGGTISLGWRF